MSGDTESFNLDGAKGEYFVEWKIESENDEQDIASIDKDTGIMTANSLGNNPIVVAAYVTGYTNRNEQSTQRIALEVNINKYYLVQGGKTVNETVRYMNTSSAKSNFNAVFKGGTRFYISYSQTYRPIYAEGNDGEGNECLYAKAKNTVASQISQFVRFNLDETEKISDYSNFKLKARVKYVIANHTSSKENYTPTGYFFTSGQEFPGSTSESEKYIYVDSNEITNILTYTNLPDGEMEEIEIDLINFSDNKYIFIGYTTGENSKTEVYIYDIWLEKKYVK